MTEIQSLTERIVDRVNINLREHHFDVGPYVRGIVSPEKYTKFYAFYGLTSRHPVSLSFKNSALAGSYFLGKCQVDFSIVYKTDVRGDELKQKGDVFKFRGFEIPLHDDELIRIQDSIMHKTLVHNFSHDPETPEDFFILNSVCLHYANIHGAPVEGSFFGPFSTVDLTTVHDSVIGAYSYVQTGELMHKRVEPGQVWIASEEDGFDFRYSYPPDVLARYVKTNEGADPSGIFMDFINERKNDFEGAFALAPYDNDQDVPRGASVSNYSVLLGRTSLSENVLVAQRCYLLDAHMGTGANAQENCFVINSKLAGYNVTAHGGKIINANMDRHCFVGFNSFLRGLDDAPLEVGADCVIMPHTIVDLREPVSIPGGHVIWGHIRDNRDLETNCISAEKFAKVQGELSMGGMRFHGNGGILVEAFKHRIEHILEANGAFFDGATNRGHAQNHEHVSFNILQPYRDGGKEGIYPTTIIQP